MFGFIFISQITDVEKDKDKIKDKFGNNLELKSGLIRAKRSEEQKIHKRLRSHKIQVHFKMIGELGLQNYILIGKHISTYVEQTRFTFLAYFIKRRLLLKII